MGELYGYARVSARDQNLARQFDALVDYGISPGNIFADKASGSNFERPEWKSLIGQLCEGDILVVKSIDRLGRNYEEILNEWRVITRGRKAAMVVLDMPLLDTRETCDNITGVLISDIVLELLSYVAQVERENIRQRQAEGIAAAKARGVRFGRPRKKRPGQYAKVKAMYRQGEITRKQASGMLNICMSTFDRWLKEDGDDANASYDSRD